jgi:hypothetical protein
MAPPDWETRHGPAAVRAVTPDQWRLHAGAHLRTSRGHFTLPNIAPYLFKPDAPRLLSFDAQPEAPEASTTRASLAMPAPPPSVIRRADTGQSRVAPLSVIDRTCIHDVTRPPPKRFSPAHSPSSSTHRRVIVFRPVSRHPTG